MSYYMRKAVNRNAYAEFGNAVMILENKYAKK